MRTENDPRIVVTGEDCAMIAAGLPYTATDLWLLFSGRHPYSTIA